MFSRNSSTKVGELVVINALVESPAFVLIRYSSFSWLFSIWLLSWLINASSILTAAALLDHCSLSVLNPTFQGYIGTFPQASFLAASITRSWKARSTVSRFCYWWCDVTVQVHKAFHFLFNLGGYQTAQFVILNTSIQACSGSGDQCKTTVSCKCSRRVDVMDKSLQ